MFIMYTANTITKSIAIKLNVCVYFFVDLPHRLLVAVFLALESLQKEMSNRNIYYMKKKAKSFNRNQRKITAETKG